MFTAVIYIREFNAGPDGIHDVPWLGIGGEDILKSIALFFKFIAPDGHITIGHFKNMIGFYILDHPIKDA